MTFIARYCIYKTMCEVNIYVRENGKDELLMKEADIVRPKNGELFIKNIMGQEKTVKAKIKEIDLLGHKIIIEKV